MSATGEAATGAPKAKKSVALSGVTAGNTSLCSVGRSGTDLHYRGYDILEVARRGASDGRHAYRCVGHGLRVA
jgi:citrate synthase